MKKLARFYKGKLWNLSFSDSNKSFYTMYPLDKPKGKSKRKTARKWLGGNEEQAQVEFTLFWDRLEGKQKTFIESETRIVRPGAFHPGNIRNPEENLSTVNVPVEEDHYFDWLRDKLNKKEFASLAEGTGYHNLVKLPEFINHTVDIPLSHIYKHYISSRKYKRSIDHDEKKKTKKAWDTFLSLIGKTTLEQITDTDIHKYENFLHDQDYSDKTINHYKNRVCKIFRRNGKKVSNKRKLREVIAYFDDFDDLEINTSDTVAAQVIELADFKKLHDNASNELKALLMLCLNTGTYIREVSRFMISEINFEHQTLMTKRNKTGQCKKLAYLWDTTISDLQTYLDTRKDDSDVLFLASHKGPYKNGAGLRTKFWNLRKKSGLLNIEFNQLRDTFETIGREIGISQYHINLVMGHGTGIKERYTHRRIHNELKNACLAIEKDFFEGLQK